MTEEQREALLSVKEVWYDQSSGSVSYNSLLNNTKEALSDCTLQAIPRVVSALNCFYPFLFPACSMVLNSLTPIRISKPCLII